MGSYTCSKANLTCRPIACTSRAANLSLPFTLITLIDQQIGRVIDELKRSGEYDNTIVCYVADHGDFAGEHGLILKNLGIYESIHRSPFLLRVPGGPSGVECDALVELVDLYPTLMHAARLPIPDHCEGRALLPVAQGNAAGADHVVCLYDFNHAQPCSIAVRTSSHRLVLYPWQPDEIGELYDTQSDPGELINRWNDPARAHAQTSLTHHALSHLSHFPRRWSTRDDGNPAFRERPTRAQRLQELGERWSAISQ